MKSVKVSEENWKTIMKIKLEKGFKSFDEILSGLLKLDISKLKVEDKS